MKRMVKLHHFVFFVTFMVVPRGTAAPVLFKWFVSRDVPTGAPFSNGTIIPIPIPSFPLLFYLHFWKLIRSADGAKRVVLVRANRPILLVDKIGRSSSKTRARTALFRFVLVIHFLLLKLIGDLSYLESFCGVLRLLFIFTFFLLILPLPRDRSAKRERGRGKDQTFNWRKLIPPFPLLIVILVYSFIGGPEIGFCEGSNAFSPPPSPAQLPEEPLTPPEAAPVPQPVPQLVPQPVWQLVPQPVPQLVPQPAWQRVVIPQLTQPLIPDDLRRHFLLQRYSFLNRGGNGDIDRLVTIIETQVLIERHIEAALVADGFNPNSIVARWGLIHGYLHSPGGVLLSPRTYESYVDQIMGRGTRESLPYRRIILAIENYDIFLD